MDNITPIHVGIATATGYQMIPNMEVDLSSTVGQLKESVAKLGNCTKEEINVIYNAEILADSSVLQKCDIQRGHVVEAVIMKAETPLSPCTTLDEKMCAIVRLLHSLMEKRSFKKIMMKLHKNGIVDDIIENTPTLPQDPVAVGLLADLRQVTLMYGNPAKIQAMNVRHPALGDALEKIINAIRLELESGVAKDLLAEEEAAAANSVQQPISSAQVAQSIQEALDRARNSADNFQPADREVGYMNMIRQVLQGSGSFSHSTPPSSAAPIPTMPESMDVSDPDLSTQQNVSQSSASSPLDPNMIASIVAQALASARGTNPSNEQQPTLMETEEASVNNAPAPAVDEDEMARNLQFMREMGLNDEQANREALILANGDLHAAVNLVLFRNSSV